MELTPRLKKAYALLGEAECIVDIGTDHAYLPIKLVEDGRFHRAVAADIAPGPLEIARENVCAAGLSDRIETVISDGFESVAAPEDYSVAVCGMGGEMIASVMAASKEKFSGARRVVLQPMTKEEKLREFLWDNGYEIIVDGAAEEDARTYTVISAIYTGHRTGHTVSELYLGLRDQREETPIMLKKLEKFHAKHTAIRHSVSLSGGDASFEDMLVRAAETEIIYLREKLK